LLFLKVLYFAPYKTCWFLSIEMLIVVMFKKRKQLD
jgi:hypothetical protein